MPLFGVEIVLFDDNGFTVTEFTTGGFFAMTGPASVGVPASVVSTTTGSNAFTVSTGPTDALGTGAETPVAAVEEEPVADELAVAEETPVAEETLVEETPVADEATEVGAQPVEG